MTKILLTVLLLFFAYFAQADQLVLIKVKSIAEKESLINNPVFKVHFQNSTFVIASTSAETKSYMVVLDKNAWQKNENYSIVYVDKQKKSNYLNMLPASAISCYEQDNLVIIKHENQIRSAKNDGMIRILPNEITLQKGSATNLPMVNVSNADAFVESLIDEITVENLESTVQHLQNYGTRIYNTPEAKQAELWIKEQFELLGLNVITQDINYEGSHKNVLAIQEGTSLPNEYILCGAHYDSYCNGDSAPGADDNASGTAGVLEIARILSQYDFDRTIIYCAWAAEEIGLVGSQFYANKAAENDMNILGYFNLDMIGYLAPDADFHIDLIYPDEAEFLANFYKQMCEIYLPDVSVERDFLSLGSSDHAAFNNYGFMGIFPFENIPYYSPYIHTVEDIIGLSLNSFEMAEKFVAASLASVATMSNMVFPPQNFVAIAGNEMIRLHWKSVSGISKYMLYRNNEFLIELNGTKDSYIDENVVNETQYTYKICGISEEIGEESLFVSSLPVTPMTDLVIPYSNDFETNITYWDTEGEWGLFSNNNTQNASLTDSPISDYKSEINSSVTLRHFKIADTTSSIYVNYKVKYNLEEYYDNVHFEILNDGVWEKLATYTNMQNTWKHVSHSLNNYIGKSELKLRFRIKTDPMFEMDGIYIDDFSIGNKALYTNESPVALKPIQLYPNPAKGSINICGDGITHIEIFSINGELIEQNEIYTNQYKLDLELYNTGIYLMHIKTEKDLYTERFILE